VISEFISAGAVDGPARVEHHGRNQRQLQPLVGQDPDWEEVARHDCEQDWSREHCAHRCAPREISDLGLALGHLVVLG
jgi:hypothetical protein